MYYVTQWGILWRVGRDILKDVPKSMGTECFEFVTCFAVDHIFEDRDRADAHAAALNEQMWLAPPLEILVISDNEIKESLAAVPGAVEDWLRRRLDVYIITRLW